MSYAGIHTVVAVDVRLNSLQYSNLCDRLISPIRTARDVVIHQSLGDRFAAAFKEQVERNGVYRLPREGPVSNNSSSSSCCCK